MHKLESKMRERERERVQSQRCEKYRTEWAAKGSQQ
jgi:hypothetical protein